MPESREFASGKARDMGNLGYQKVLAFDQDLWWRRQVDSNHIPQSGTIQVSTGGQSLMASTSRAPARQINYNMFMLNNNENNLSEEKLFNSAFGIVVPVDTCKQYSRL